MAKKLVLIKGGKLPPGQSGKSGGKPPRKNPFNDLLWHVTSNAHYKNRAKDVEEIAERMTRRSKPFLGRHVNFTEAMVNHIIYDGRRRANVYGWILFNVEKGAMGSNRGYVALPMDVDVDDYPSWVLYETDLAYVYSGAISAIGTQTGMMATTTVGLSLLIGAIEAMIQHAVATGKRSAEVKGWRANVDDLREVLADYRSVQRRATEVLKRILNGGQW